MVHLKKASIDDLDSIVELEKLNFRPINRASRKTIEDRFHRYPGGALLFDHESPIGYVTYGPIKESYVGNFKNNPEIFISPDVIRNSSEINYNDYFFLISLAINKSFRGSFIQVGDNRISCCKLLISHVLNECKVKKYKKFGILCENKKLISLFSKLNFTRLYDGEFSKLPLVLFESSINNQEIISLIELYDRFLNLCND